MQWPLSSKNPSTRAGVTCQPRKRENRNSVTREPTLHQVDMPLVHSTLNPIRLYEPWNDSYRRVKNRYLGCMREPLHKLFNLFIYGRPTNTFRDRQKD
jgi:hypothetical protein